MEKSDLGVYVHIPFCVRKCDYCDFPSGSAAPDEQAYYIRVLKKEIHSFEALGNLYRVRTLFFGGGTPSLLDPAQLERLMGQLREQYEFAEDLEATIECNPGTLTEEKLARYREMGFNRLSMGFQSANPEELRVLGRIHSWQDCVDSFQMARRAGFENINVDLMSALPGQTKESWMRTLEQAVALSPEHISAYSLSIEPGTPFYDRYAEGKGAALLPDEETDREMYHETKTFLSEHGYHRYEISNYAKKGRECRHNIAYWTGGAYVGFGLGAASYLRGRRFSMPKDKKEYWAASRRAYQTYQAARPQTEQEAMEEFMFLGLRMTAGISRKKFEERFSVPLADVYGEPVRRLAEQGLLEEDGDALRLTEQGIDVSNRVLSEFLL